MGITHIENVTFEEAELIELVVSSMRYVPAGVINPHLEIGFFPVSGGESWEASLAGCLDWLLLEEFGPCHEDSFDYAI